MSGRVILGADAKSGIGSLSSSGFAASRDRPLGAGNFEARMIIKGGESECVEIPFGKGPIAEVALQVLLQKSLQVGVAESFVLQLEGGVLRGNRLRLETGATADGKGR